MNPGIAEDVLFPYTFHQYTEDVVPRCHLVAPPLEFMTHAEAERRNTLMKGARCMDLWMLETGSLDMWIPESGTPKAVGGSSWNPLIALDLDPLPSRRFGTQMCF